MKLWSLTVEVAGFGLVTTLHGSEEEAWEQLRDEHNQGREADPGVPVDVAQDCLVEDYLIEEHDLPLPEQDLEPDHSIVDPGTEAA
jgi:hypothetical protein